MANTFSSILSRPASDFERPKPAPVGTYLFTIHGNPRLDKSSKKQTEFSEYTCNFVQAGDDVDADELKAYGGIAGKQMKVTFYHTEGSLWRLREFLAALGMDEAEYESLGDMIEDTNGKQFLGTVEHEPSDDGKAVFAKIVGWAQPE